MFSVVDTLDLRSLPYADADRLVSLQELSPANDPACPRCDWGTAAPTARDWVSQVRSYDALLVADNQSFVWEHDDVEENPGGGMATPGLLHFFGLQPLLGRDLIAADTLPGADPVIVLTYDFWQKRFQSDPHVIGTRLHARLGRLTSAPQTVTVVGVAPSAFRVMPYFEVWSAMPLRGNGSRDSRYVTVMGRLQAGTTMGAATAELRAVSSRLAQSYPAEFRGWSAEVVPLRDRLADTAGTGRGVLFAITLAVLLVAVLNVTGLLFNRAAARQPEFAMRAALGAGRMRLFRQLLVEGSCVGLLGGLIGVALAFAGVEIAAGWFHVADAGLALSVDARMLAFASLLSLTVGIAAAVAPAARASRVDATRGFLPRLTAGSQASHTSSVLIAAQIALAFTLLTVATLLSHDFLELRYLDLGYDPQGVFATSITGSREQWINPEPWKPLVVAARERVARIRGVESASLLYESAVHPEIIRPDVPTSATMRDPRLQAVDPDFFGTWKSPVLIGRAFTARDRAGAPLVAIVNKAAASTFWPGQNPLGRRVFAADSGSAGEWLTVVGVTEDMETGLYSRRHHPVVYRPFDQARLYHASVRLSVRVSGDRLDALAAAQTAIRDVTGRRSEPLQSEDSRLATRYVTRRFNAIALDVFAGFGLLLAAMGIYGSVAFAVTRRTREIGIRVALGAARTNVVALIARRGVFLTLAGAGIGVAASLAVTRVFRSFVSATSVTNPWIVVASVVVVLIVSLFATFLPARRASGVDPMIALRAE
jgi:putative ABC transport system permease protein